MLAAKDVEPGYEADAELETGLSDVSSKGTCVARCRKPREKPKQRTERAERYILYPSMCEQLVYFIENGCGTV